MYQERSIVMHVFWILCVIVAFYCARAFAGDTIVCSPDPRATQLALTMGKETVEVRVFAPMGYEQLPQFEAPVSEASLPFMKQQIEDLRPLTGMFRVVWDRKQCEQDEDQPMLMQCSGPGKIIDPLDQEIAGVRALGVTGHVLTEKAMGGSFTQWVLRFVIESTAIPDQANAYFVTMPFPTEMCAGG